MDVCLGHARTCSALQDPQRDFAFLREKLWVSRINPIFRVHGHAIPTEETAVKTPDEVGQVFPGFTEDRSQQAALGASQSGIGCKRSVDVARPAHLGALIAARPPIRDMFRDATLAGLLPEQRLVARLDHLIQAASTALLNTLDDGEKLTARFYLQKQPRQQTRRGSKSCKVTTAHRSRTQRLQK